VEAARFELASLTVEVRSLYMLSPFLDSSLNVERTQFQRVSPLRVLSLGRGHAETTSAKALGGSAALCGGSLLSTPDLIPQTRMSGR